MTRLFISQKRMDRLTAEDGAVLDGDRLDLPAIAESFRILPALRFLSVVDGADTQDLVGRVRSEESLRAVGADLLHTSAIVGETAYECEPGFLGEASTGAAWIGRLGEMPA